VDFLVLDVAAGRDHPHAVERQAVVRRVVALHVFAEIDAFAGHGFGDVLDFLEDPEHFGHLAVFQRGRAVEVDMRTSSIPSSIITRESGGRSDVALLLLRLIL
jgi:hypothetical protein